MFEQSFIGKLKIHSVDIRSIWDHITAITIKSSSMSNLSDLYIDFYHFAAVNYIEGQRLRQSPSECLDVIYGKIDGSPRTFTGVAGIPSMNGIIHRKSQRTKTQTTNNNTAHRQQNEYIPFYRLFSVRTLWNPKRLWNAGGWRYHHK